METTHQKQNSKRCLEDVSWSDALTYFFPSPPFPSSPFLPSPSSPSLPFPSFPFLPFPSPPFPSAPAPSSCNVQRYIREHRALNTLSSNKNGFVIYQNYSFFSFFFCSFLSFFFFSFSSLEKKKIINTFNDSVPYIIIGTVFYKGFTYLLRVKAILTLHCYCCYSHWTDDEGLIAVHFWEKDNVLHIKLIKSSQ